MMSATSRLRKRSKPETPRKTCRNTTRIKQEKESSFEEIESSYDSIRAKRQHFVDPSSDVHTDVIDLIRAEQFKDGNAPINSICLLCDRFISPISLRFCTKGHGLHANCAAKWLESESTCPDATCTDPLCIDQLCKGGSIVSEFWIHFTIECRNASQQCQWSDSVANYKTHLHECHYESVYCHNQNCQEGKMLRRDLKQHELVCLAQTISCPQCEWTGLLSLLASHTEDECSATLITCACGADAFKRCNQSAHDEVCPDQIVSCALSSIGCTWSSLRKHAAVHSRESIDEHMLLMSQRILDVEHNVIHTLDARIQNALLKHSADIMASVTNPLTTQQHDTLQLSDSLNLIWMIPSNTLLSYLKAPAKRSCATPRFTYLNSRGFALNASPLNFRAFLCFDNSQRVKKRELGVFIEAFSGRHDLSPGVAIRFSIRMLDAEKKFVVRCVEGTRAHAFFKPGEIVGGEFGHINKIKECRHTVSNEITFIISVMIVRDDEGSTLDNVPAEMNMVLPPWNQAASRSLLTDCATSSDK